MNEFPEFMQNPANKIDPGSQFTKGITGWVFDGADGSQMCYWTNPVGGHSAEHTHDYDEYMVVVRGQYTVIIGDKKFVLGPGDEFLIKKGLAHSGDSSPHTRTIHCFGGKRADRVKTGTS
jgi:quercetin dioxygenase-like cupin family protein